MSSINEEANFYKILNTTRTWWTTSISPKILNQLLPTNKLETKQMNTLLMKIEW